MKFRVIENTKTRQTKRLAKLRITPKGALTLSKAALEQTGLKEGDRLLLLQDLDKPNDWYLATTTLELFSPLRKISSGTSMGANYAKAHQELAEYFWLPKDQAFDVNLGGAIKTEFGTAHVLITAPLIEIKRKAEAVPGRMEVVNG
jgi:hypothetical protein